MKRRARKVSHIPEINIVPMLDVILTVLMFFIIVSTMLTNAKTVKDVSLPSTDKTSATTDEPPNPLIVGVNKQGQMVIDDVVVDDAKLAQSVVDYLQKNPKGAVVVKADKSLNYEKVVQAIAVLRDVGGDKVSLAVE
jgi:biopolymer transport protein ExbD